MLLFIKAVMTGIQTKTGLYSVLTFDSEWMMISVLPFIWLYNGQRGKYQIFLLYHLPCSLMDFDDFKIFVYQIGITILIIM